MSITLKGKKFVEFKLKAESKIMKAKALQGMINAAIIIRRDMDSTPPLIPVDYGILRQSWFVATSKGTTPMKGSEADGGVISEAKGRARSSPYPMVIMGFTADYAGYVHDREWKEGSRPGSGPKFFESAINRNASAITAVISQSMKMK